jgi:hypothetical protein
MPKNPAAVELGRLGGKAKSERKTASSRMNAKRPRKPQPQPIQPNDNDNFRTNTEPTAI